MRKIFILAAFIYLFSPVIAQENPTTEITIEEAKEKSRGFFKQFFEFRIFADALKVRQFYDIHRTNTHNLELQEKIVDFRVTNINFSVKGEVDYDHFWVWISNNPSARTPDGYLPQMLKADYTVKFKPIWEITLAPPKDNREYTCSVNSNFDQSIINNLNLDKSKFDDVVNNSYLEGENSKNIILRNQDIPAFTNVGLFNGLAYIEQRLNIGPASVIEIKEYTQKFIPNNDDDKFKLSFNLKKSDAANIEKVHLEIYKKTGDEEEILHKTDDVTDLENISSFEWNGLIATSENTEEDRFVTYADNPLYARVVASEGSGGKSFDVKEEFKVKGELVDIISINDMFDLNNNEVINLEYTIEQVEDVSIQYGKFEIIDKDKNIIASGELDISKLEDIENGKYRKGNLTWPKAEDINSFITKVDVEKNPYQVVLKVSGNEDFTTESTYLTNAISEVMPEIVEIPEYDEEFASLYKPLNNEGFKIKYEVKDLSKYEIKYAKVEVYKPNSTEPCFVKPLLNNGAKINTEDQLTENEFKGKFTWDGKMNQETDADKFIERVDEDKPFKVIISASKTKDYKKNYKATINSNVDEYSREWNKCPELHGYVELITSGKNKHPEKNRYRRYIFLREKLEIYIESKRVDLNESSPIEYFAGYTEQIIFLGQNIRVHKNFNSILNEIENQMGGRNVLNDYNKLGHYKNKLGVLSIRLVRGGTSISNHGFGFAIDVDYVNNPMLGGDDFYKFVHFVTGYNMWGVRSSADDMTVANDALIKFFNEKLTLNELISFLNTISNNTLDSERSILDYAWVDLNNRIENIYQLYSIIYDNVTSNSSTIDNCQTLISIIEQLQIYLSDLMRDVEAYEDGLFLTEKNNLIDDKYATEEFKYLANYIYHISLNTDKLLEGLKLIVENIENNKNTDVDEIANNIIPEHCQLNLSQMAQLNQKIKNKINIIGGKDNLQEFVEDYLEINLSSGHKLNKLVIDGFLGLETEFVDFFIYDYDHGDYEVERIKREEIMWGGQFMYRKDWMHFEVIDEFQNFK